jgi:NADPH-dependent glutamate synthase beta subunit-like oxidoreductase
MVESYDAVFLGVGREPVRTLGIEREDLDGVLGGNDVLRATWLGVPPKLGPRVMVVGGGFAALDVVRTARRLGCPQVEMVYRRGVDEMLRPGSGPFFVGLLAEEGVQCRFMSDPKRIIGRDRRVVAVEIVKTEYGEPEASGWPGRRSVRATAGSEHIVEVDTLILSIGEGSQGVGLATAVGAQLNGRGGIEVDPITWQTANPKVWAGGDATGNGNEVAAVDGLWAARAIDAYLSGRLDSWRVQAAERVKDTRF